VTGSAPARLHALGLALPGVGGDSNYANPDAVEIQLICTAV
jgi:hypothetical protein